MAKKSKPDPAVPHHGLGERIHDRIVAAEVAAEEAAGYGPGTAAVEAAEAAADPDREAGDEDEKSAAKDAPTPDR